MSNKSKMFYQTGYFINIDMKLYVQLTMLHQTFLKQPWTLFLCNSYVRSNNSKRVFNVQLKFPGNFFNDDLKLSNLEGYIKQS